MEWNEDVVCGGGKGDSLNGMSVDLGGGAHRSSVWGKDFGESGISGEKRGK